MADAQQQLAGSRPPVEPQSRNATPVSLLDRTLAAIGLLVVAALGYALLALVNLVPVPSSVAQLAKAQSIGKSRVIVSGYYITQHFTSMGGPQLPPYAFAAGPEVGAPSVRVSPTLPDVKANRVAAIIDTATGDGSEASPYSIHTLGSFDSLVTGVIVGVLVAAAFAMWLAGTIVGLLRRRR